MTATVTTQQAKDGTATPYTLASASESVSGAKANTVYVKDPNSEGIITPAQEGTDSTGVTQLSGGAGIRGWLSGIFSKLSSILTAIGTPMQATGGTVGLVTGSALIGKLGIDQTSFGSSNAVTLPPSSNGAIALAFQATSVLASSLSKSSPGNLYSVYVTTGSTAGYLMIFNATSI